MAGDWIKMRNDLWTDPRVTGVADALEVSEATVVGGVFYLWSTADLHSVDGLLKGMSLRAFDRRCGVPGLGAELVRIGWLLECEQGLQVTNFDRHNSASAKRRAQDARNKAQRRRSDASDTADEPAPRRRSYVPSSAVTTDDPHPAPVVKVSAHPAPVVKVSARAADTNGTAAGARVRERVRERKEKENPPPPSLSAESPAPPSARPPRWVAEVEEELILLGIDDLSCLQSAIDAGLIEPAIRELLRHYREQQTAQGWTPKALHYRLRTAKTTLPSDRGWPQPAPEAARQQQQIAQEQQRLQAEARRQQQKSAEQQRKQLAAQTYDSLNRQFGATLDALSDADALALAASVSPDLAKRLRSVGDRSVRSIRGQLLGRLAGQRAEQLESALGPQLDALPPQELQDLAARAGTHCLQQIKRNDPLQGQLRHQLLLALHDATTTRSKHDNN